jgi:FkbM family methyltransferase
MKNAPASEPSSVLPRIWRFLHKTREEKARSFYARWVRIFPKTPLPIHLPSGMWWLARNDFLGASFFYEGFENPERSFVARFLRSGMVVLDVGAHQGLYTLIASKTVGPAGRVFSFEPSPREQEALHWNLIVNRCKNVSIQALALGDEEEQVDLYVASDKHSGLNTLRPSDTSSPTTQVKVRVRRLDDWLRDAGVDVVDFIKLDVEGGELAVLQGGAKLLERRPRPVILAELEDARSESWGHRAKDTADLLQRFGFQWFKLLHDGIPERMPLNPERYEGNFVAVPDERMEEVARVEKSEWFSFAGE